MQDNEGKCDMQYPSMDNLQTIEIIATLGRHDIQYLHWITYKVKMIK